MTTPADFPSMPTSAGNMLLDMRRTSYHEEALQVLEQRIVRMIDECEERRAALARAEERAERAEAEANAWMRLASKYASDLVVTWRDRSHDMEGQLVIAHEAVALGGDEVITAVCFDLARKLIAVRKQARASQPAATEPSA